MLKKLAILVCYFAKIESMEFFGAVFALLFTFFWILIMPLVISTLVYLASEFLVKEELMKKETYENLTNSEYVIFYYIGWFLFLWFLDSQGYSYMPLYA